MEIKLCPNCGSENPVDTWNCVNCGITLSVKTVIREDDPDAGNKASIEAEQRRLSWDQDDQIAPSRESMEEELTTTTMPASVFKFKSKAIGNVHKYLLLGNVILYLLYAFLVYGSLPFIRVDAPAEDMTSVEILLGCLIGISSILWIIVLIVCIIVFLVWMYRLHADLIQWRRDYPIEPGAALARLMIPIYNFWGLWNVFSTLSTNLTRLYRQHMEAKQYTIDPWKPFPNHLRTWLTGLYIVNISSGVVVGITRGYCNGECVLPLYIDLLNDILSLAQFIIWLQL